GVHPEDSKIVSLMRKSKKPVLWLVNKSEKPSTELAAAEFYSLGIDELIFLSAAHRKGLKELLAQIKVKLHDATVESAEDSETEVEDGEHSIKVAILGKPNVGKSTLINKLIGQNRLVTSDMAGTTTDSVDIEMEYKGKAYTLIDTAGLRR